MNPRQLFLSVAIGLSIETSAEEASMKSHTAAVAVALAIEGELSSLGGATEWINSAPLTTAGLRGKVVLVEFWTYTCINWLRPLPYVRALAAKIPGPGTRRARRPGAHPRRGGPRARRRGRARHAALPSASPEDREVLLAFLYQL
jgi:hypothetical protein